MTDPTKTAIDDTLQTRFKLVEYLIKRLDHTHSHTQTTTNLIYLVNGGVLAFAYFAVGIIRPRSLAFSLAAFVLLILALINLLHALLLNNQRHWYRVIDKRIEDVLNSLPGVAELNLPWLHVTYGAALDSSSLYRWLKGPQLGSSHRVFTTIHCLLAAALFFLSIAALAGAIGWIPHLSITPATKR